MGYGIREAGCFLVTAAVLAQTQQVPRPGQVLFTKYCAVCHGAFGDGGSAPDLTNPVWQAGTSDAQLGRIIRDGVKGTAMPAFAGTFDATEERDVLQHIRSLGAQAIQPTTTVKTPRIYVDSQRLLAAASDHDNWLMYGRDYASNSFSSLDQINARNVKSLVPLWSFQTLGGHAVVCRWRDLSQRFLESSVRDRR
jgi:hypothetical protein